jgi:hydrogenase expression/formation protein HypE
MRALPEGAEAVRIGEVVADHPGMVTIRTIVGSERTVVMVGEQLPRICRCAAIGSRTTRV